jgi:hypothetical protein
VTYTLNSSISNTTKKIFFALKSFKNGLLDDRKRHGDLRVMRERVIEEEMVEAVEWVKPLKKGE